jgi:hypothetical protein
MTVIPFPSPKNSAPPAIATDALADLIFSLILDREAELVALVRGSRGKKSRSWPLFECSFG